ncbi:MAG: hypothetical protein FD188_3466 [Ignavibacteria bacterium]|nr:MAG: hypothetical protein FD188_3466 [Ignavibacteria bacterium]
MLFPLQGYSSIFQKHTRMFYLYSIMQKLLLCNYNLKHFAHVGNILSLFRIIDMNDEEAEFERNTRKWLFLG